MISITIFMALVSPSYCQRFYHTQNGSVTLLLPFKDTLVMANASDLEIVLDKPEGELFLTIQVGSFKTGITELDQSLFNANHHVLVIKGSLNKEDITSQGISFKNFSFVGFILSQGKYAIAAGAGRIEHAQDRVKGLYRISLNFGIESRWLGALLEKRLANTVVGVQVKQSNLMPFNFPD